MPRTVPRRPPTVAERVAAIVDRVDRLTIDDLDRLALAEPAPIAFLATVRRFVDTDLQDLLDEAERAALERLPRAARRDPAIRDAVTGKLADLVLGDALDELLGELAGDRARERLTRGWDAAVGQPRYGPATPAVEDLLDPPRDVVGGGDPGARRDRDQGAAGRRSVARLARHRTRTRPCACRPSSPVATPRPRWAAAHLGAAHRGPMATVQPKRPSASARPLAGRQRASPTCSVLRHAIHAAEFERLAAPWLGDLVPRRAPWSARVHRR